MALTSYDRSFKSFVTVWTEAFSTSTLKNQTSENFFGGLASIRADVKQFPFT